VNLSGLVWSRGEKSLRFGSPVAVEPQRLQRLPEADASTCSGSRIKEVSEQGVMTYRLGGPRFFGW
jgi:hypothetical protein